MSDYRETLERWLSDEGCHPPARSPYRAVEVMLDEVERLRAELRYIAEAKPSEWGDMADEFQKWAQNRARQALTGGREK